MAKTGNLVEAPSDSEAAYFGNLLEDLVAREYARRNEVDIQRASEPFQHKRLPFFRGNIDRRILRVREGLEIKTINAYSGAKLDQPLDKHAMQCHGYMAVTGWDRWHIAYLIGGQRFTQFTIERDPEMIEMIECLADEFWGYVQRDEMPPIDHEHPRAEDLIRRLHPGTDGSTIRLDPSIEHWHRVRQESLALSKRYDTAADVAKCHILSAMGDAAIGLLPDDTRYTRKVITRKAYQVEESTYLDFRFSSKASKEEKA
jgi:predicted phage-related endonuclease